MSRLASDMQTWKTEWHTYSWLCIVLMPLCSVSLHIILKIGCRIENKFSVRKSGGPLAVSNEQGGARYKKLNMFFHNENKIDLFFIFIAILTFNAYKLISLNDYLHE